MLIVFENCFRKKHNKIVLKNLFITFILLLGRTPLTVTNLTQNFNFQFHFQPEQALVNYNFV